MTIFPEAIAIDGKVKVTASSVKVERAKISEPHKTFFKKGKNFNTP
ncbi:MAG: hypothetical protein H7126_06855 [Candidatus Parcubacteria bacterium]|nr:hypothetical protein [Phormidesmis priestleyi]MBC7823585.1 hypothetical protein [Leptolyngbyaceae cyanobacterium LF-bin-113]